MLNLIQNYFTKLREHALLVRRLMIIKSYYIFRVRDLVPYDFHKEGY